MVLRRRGTGPNPTAIKTGPIKVIVEKPGALQYGHDLECSVFWHPPLAKARFLFQHRVKR